MYVALPDPASPFIGLLCATAGPALSLLIPQRGRAALVGQLRQACGTALLEFSFSLSYPLTLALSLISRGLAAPRSFASPVFQSSYQNYLNTLSPTD